MDLTVTIITSVISCAVSFVLGGALAFITARGKGMMKREKALRKGVQSLLRNQLIEYHDKYTERDFCPIYAKDAARRSYEAYHELGGNGVVTKLFDDLMALPEEPRPTESRSADRPAESRSAGTHPANTEDNDA